MYIFKDIYSILKQLHRSIMFIANKCIPIPKLQRSDMYCGIFRPAGALFSHRINTTNMTSRWDYGDVNVLDIPI